MFQLQWLSIQDSPQPEVAPDATFLSREHRKLKEPVICAHLHCRSAGWTFSRDALPTFGLQPGRGSCVCLSMRATPNHPKVIKEAMAAVICGFISFSIMGYSREQVPLYEALFFFAAP